MRKLIGIILFLAGSTCWGFIPSNDGVHQDFGLPHLPPPVSSEIDGLPELMDPWANIPDESIEQEAADSAISSCIQMCQQARAGFERGADNPCEDVELPNNFFCPQTYRRRVNPFEIYRALNSDDDNREEGIDQVCIQYLLQRASREMEQADRQLVLNRRQRETAQLARAMYALHGDCREVANQFPEVSELTSEALNTADMNLEIGPQHNNYCDMVGKGCAWLGGWQRRINGELVCVSRGMVIDQSCLNASPVHQRRLRQAVYSVRGRNGLGCLSDLNEAAGQKLRDLIRAEEPNTRICCGRDCETELEGFSTESTRAAGTSLGRTVGGSGPKGDIHLFDGAFKSTRDLSGTLFHEYLHRIGMCTHPNHDDSSRNLVRDQPGTSFVHQPSCPSGYSATGVTRMQIDTISRIEGCSGENCCRPGFSECCEEGRFATCMKKVVANAMGIKWEHAFPGLSDGDPIMGALGSGGTQFYFCARRNMCGGGLMRASDLNSIDLLDPVYACENACFGTHHQNGNIRAHSRRLCSATADGEGSTCEAQEITHQRVREINGQ